METIWNCVTLSWYQHADVRKTGGYLRRVWHRAKEGENERERKRKDYRGVYVTSDAFQERGSLLRRDDAKLPSIA